MNLVSLLGENARLYPGRAALVDSHHGQDRVVSFGELAQRVAAGAATLQDYGLKRGQVILVFQPVSIELYEILLAAFHLGLRVMLADPSAGRGFLALCCQRLRPNAYFGSWKAQCLRLAVGEMRRIPVAISADWFPATKAWRTDSDGLPACEITADEPALITFTSGSTGVPKAAMRTHGFLLAQHRALLKSLDFKCGEVDLITLPVFVLANLASGLTSVLAATDLAMPGSPDVVAVAAQCEKFHVTRCAASPAFFEGFLASPTGLPRFRKLFTGGAPVFPDLLRRLSAALPEADIHSVYGSTEAEPIAHFPATEADEETNAITGKGGGLCSGLPVVEIEARVIADHWGTPLGPLTQDGFGALRLPDGEAGEIVVSGDHVLPGYLDGAGDADTKIHVAGKVWHRTGDAGWFDSRGRIWLLGRCAEKLPTCAAPNGLPREALSYPFAVECAMREIFPGIRMAALDWQGLGTLVIGKKVDATLLAAIQSASRAFGIARCIVLDPLPMDPRHHAKIHYPALRDQLAKN